MKLRLVLLSAALFALLTACATLVTPPGPGAPDLPELTPGTWTAFSPEGETICSDGSPYSYYVHPGTVNKVVIDFEGAGPAGTARPAAGRTISRVSRTRKGA